MVIPGQEMLSPEQAHCLRILRLTAYVFLGSLPMYSQAHYLCILRLTAYVFFCEERVELVEAEVVWSDQFAQ